MMYYVLICNIAVIPLICSAVVKTGNSSITLTDTHVKNKTKVLLSEGGSILDEVAELSLPSNNTIYNLDFETGKTKGSVVARKGVPPLLPSSQSSSTTSDESIDTHKELDKNVVLNKDFNKPLTSSNVSVPITTTVKNISKKIEIKKKIPKKPPVLSYDKLMETASNASPASFVSNQINSPNKDMKIYMSSDVNSHPGMVMPIVITILLVPMFAVLGFMALRRGQEAWKNRHYKRMDFLLDGMYND